MGHELSCAEKRVVGTKQVLRFARARMLKKVYVAKDADEDIIDMIKKACETHRVPYDMSHTMHQISSACQIEVGSACAGVLKT
jgi:large subunit ribosomal protein L7A